MWHRIDDPDNPPPKDGTQFQGWLTDGRKGRSVLQHWEPLCRYNSDGAFEVWGRIDYDIDGWKSDWNPEWVVTHWQPLPLPPAEETP